MTKHCVDIDDDLLARARASAGTTTLSATIEAGLRMLSEQAMALQHVRQLRRRKSINLRLIDVVRAPRIGSAVRLFRPANEPLHDHSSLRLSARRINNRTCLAGIDRVNCTSLRTSTGLPQLVPYFFWAPYAVVGFRLGPNIPLNAAVQLFGVALSVLGVGFSMWSIISLGRHYDLVLEVHAGHQLVRAGPFAWVRHPVYTGLALHFVGACLATGSVLLLIGTLFVTLPAFYARGRAEEKLLREQFGSEYDRYRDEVPMLVPGLRVRRGKK